VLLNDNTDWEEFRELVTESTAPKKLIVGRPAVDSSEGGL
jgi:hypothetical protein